MSIVKEQGATRWVRPGDYLRPKPSNKPYRHIPRRVSPRPNLVPRTPVPFPGRKMPVPARPVPALAPSKLPGLARLSGRLIPGLGALAALMEVADLIDRGVFNNPVKNYRPNPANGWVKCWGDCPQNPPNHSMSGIGACNLPSPCLSGQNVGSTAPVGVLPPPNNVTSWTLIYKYWNATLNAWKGQLHSYYRRTRTGTQAEPLMVPQTEVQPAINPEWDPNLRRRWPSIRRGGPELDPARNPGDPLRGPRPELTTPEVRDILDDLSRQSFEVEAKPRPGLTPTPKPGEGTQPQMPPPVPPARPKPPHVRAKPPRNTKEKKARGPLYYFFAVADRFSEYAEVVDALFEALPEDVQKRWSKGRKPRKFIDNAGQYGIDGADWKAQAVFHNFHKIDIEEALRNIVKNEIEDKLIGSLHRNLPRNFINAAKDGQKAYSELVTEMLEGLGL